MSLQNEKEIQSHEEIEKHNLERMLTPEKGQYKERGKEQEIIVETKTAIDEFSAGEDGKTDQKMKEWLEKAIRMGMVLWLVEIWAWRRDWKGQCSL